MMKINAIFILLMLIPILGHSTRMLKITKNTFQFKSVFDYEDDTLYKSETITINDAKVIESLLEEMKQNQTFDDFFSYNMIDDFTQIISIPQKLIKYYSNKDDFDWNKEQLSYIKKELTISNYKEYFENYIHYELCFSMYCDKYQIIAELYDNEKIIEQLISRKYRNGNRQIAWKIRDTEFYNSKLDKLMNDLFSLGIELPNENISKRKLLKILTTELIDDNKVRLYKLSPSTHKEEIDELKTDFKIVSSEEIYARGRYIWNEPTTYKITLKNQEMLTNVQIQFLCSRFKKKLYSRDSIKVEYKTILKKVQNIDFIKEHLNKNPNSILDIYYFNNSGINEYTINGVNKNPKEWAIYDERVKGGNFYEKHNITPTFDIEKAKETSKGLYCGCNYRFEREFIEQAIFMELITEHGKSIWLLLPDNTVLLYLMSGQYILKDENYDEKLFESYKPCILHDITGKIIIK